MNKSPLVALMLVASPVLAQPCVPRWSAFPGPSLLSRVMAIHDGMEGNFPGMLVSGQASWSTRVFSPHPRGYVPVSPWLGGGFGYDSCCALVDEFAVFRGELVVGGRFERGTNNDGLVHSIVRWNGSSWISLGPLFDTPDCDHCGATVRTMQVWGDSLYAGGEFSHNGGLRCNNIAQWDGVTWSSLGSGFQAGVSGPWGSVWDLEVFEGHLYIAGDFKLAGGIPLEGLARWNGQSFESVGGGLWSPPTVAFYAKAECLAIHDDGSGPALYVSGTFETAGGVPARNLARWDGDRWSSVGDLLSTGAGKVYALASFDDGSGPALFAGGDFTANHNRIAKWNGQQWLSLRSGVSGPVSVLKPVSIDGVVHLAVGGNFASAGGIPSPNLALWTPCLCYANCDGSTRAPILSANDFQCFINAFATGASSADCDSIGGLTAADFQCFIDRYAAGCP